MRAARLALVLASLALAAPAAHANGRPPATSSVHIRQGHDADIAAGMTFGLVISHDGGATWQWMCEKAIGYGGIYDPQYIYASNGALFATTFDGLMVSRDGCTFGKTPLASKFVSTIALGPDGVVYAAVSDPATGGIYTSADTETFTEASSPGQLGDYYQSIAVAPSDASRVYLAGFRIEPNQGRTFLLYRSDNAAGAFTALPVTGFVTSSSSTLEIAGVSPTDPDVVFARVTKVTANVGDAIYRSTNGGQSFTKVFEAQDSLAAFVVRANGNVVIGTASKGYFLSTDGGATFQPLPTTPELHTICLAENSAGLLWACAQNFGPEAMGLATSMDAQTWSSALHYKDIQQPVACAAGTDQHDFCEVQNWCTLRAQLGITSTNPPCASLADGPIGGDVTPPPSKGCCDAGGDRGGAILGALGLVLLRVRRRRGGGRSAPARY